MELSGYFSYTGSFLFWLACFHYTLYSRSYGWLWPRLWGNWWCLLGFLGTCYFFLGYLSSHRSGSLLPRLQIHTEGMFTFFRVNCRHLVVSPLLQTDPLMVHFFYYLRLDKLINFTHGQYLANFTKGKRVRKTLIWGVCLQQSNYMGCKYKTEIVQGFYVQLTLLLLA